MRPFDFKDGDHNYPLIRTTHKDVGDFWILTDGYTVSIHQQKVGEASTQDITIPRDEFNRLIAWYMRDQKPTGKAARRKSATRDMEASRG